MSISSNNLLPKLSFFSTTPSLPPQFHKFPNYRRRRLKPNRNLTVRTTPNPFHNFFHALISQFPSLNTNFNLFAPALGDWILLATPTPFNRFVFLRCPSISFPGSDLLEDANEKLVKEERHFVTVNSGRIQVTRERVLEDGDLTYQRVCVTTEDGGVVSLDWPANLDLEEERGLDSTLLLVPGTPQGSMDTNIKSFVLESLKRGFFPVVMNPRGCAGSPLTSARLFTAADSDDIGTAIKYINKARPWTTLMGVGWGFGANMLTKYLAEVGERTPLTAATCINNPFDLEEATRSSPYHIATDQKLTGGLIDILQTNKELFRGKTKDFDVEKALLAKTVRDFEEAISMVSHGFEAIEDFYSKSSTRNVIGKIKIPVLFIQSDDGTVPVFSIPRNLIAENPFTSLLLCTCLPSSNIGIDRSTLSWCQILTIEWLTAVELGLLKGRHPLLTDIDVTINSSKGLSVVEDINLDKRNEASRLLDLTRSDVFDGYTVDPAKDMLEESESDSSLGSRYQQDYQRNLKLGDTGLQLDNGLLQQTTSTVGDSIEEENVGSVDSEHGQVLQTAQVVTNMLDVTMPGTLTEEKKKKVLTAVGKGETLMKALQDAVPEEVRGKLTAAVTGILHAQGTNLKFDRVLRIAQDPDTLSRVKNQENFTGVSGSEGLSEDHSSSNRMKSTSSSADVNEGGPTGTGEPTEGTESEVHPSQNPQSSANLAQSHDPNSEVGSPGSFKKETSTSRSNNDTNEQVKEVVTPDLDHNEKKLETVSKPQTANQHEEGAASDQQKRQNSGIFQTETMEENKIQKEEHKTQDSSTDESKMTSTDTREESPSPPVSSEPQTTEMEGNNIEKKETNNLQHMTDQTKSTSFDSSASAFSFSQALDALTGIDDSTQAAVNSVFGVMENMISQLEENSDNEGKLNDKKDCQEFQEQQKCDRQSMESNVLGDPSAHNHHDGSYLKNNACSTEEQQTQSLSTVNEAGAFNPQKSSFDDHVAQNKSKLNGQLIGKRVLLDEQDGQGHINRLQQYIVASSFRDPLYIQYLRQYLTSKIPTKSLDIGTTTSLLLDYFPEEGQWKLLEQPQKAEISSGNVKGTGGKMKTHAKSFDTEQCIEPPYIILNSEKQQPPVKEFITTDNMNEKIDTGSDKSEELIQFVKKDLLHSLKMEVSRKLSSAELKDMKLKVTGDLEHVANAISQVIRRSKVQLLHTETQFHNIKGAEAKVGTLDGEHIIRVISSSVQETDYLRRLMPVGVIVGTSLAALRKYFHVATVQDNGQKGSLTDNDSKKACESNYGNVDHSIERDGVKSESENINKNSVMVGAVTAALGASALLMQQQNPFKGNETTESSSSSLKTRYSHQKELEKLEEVVSEKNQNTVTSFAEKAMSVAGPVVPTKDDGEVDQERLVAMLADLGQKGGMLRLVGKIALLWGGIRGAMSLTDRLISFFRIAERPLFQRITGFVGMVLVLWSPVAIPLLPALVGSWTTNTPSRIAELACIIGLYTAFMILVMLWGKRIRGYENAYKQYGLEISPPKIFDFLKGLVGGVILVFSIHAINAFFGWASFSRPPIPPSSDIMTWLKLHGRMVMLVVQGTFMATAIALVEELLFRSWLPEEIAVDLGYYPGIVISGLAFSLFQRSLQAIPALWLLSFSLSGIRQRNGGSLSIPIGLRGGMMASNFILQKGLFLSYNTNLPSWLIGTHPFQPFSGITGLIFSISLALLLYPTQTSQKKVAQG